MRNAVLLCVLALFALPAHAAGSRFDGTWKMNLAKSSWSNGEMAANMSLTITLAIHGDTLQYHSVNDTDKTKPMGATYEAAIDGKPHPLGGSKRYNQVSVRWVDQNSFELLELKDGDVIVGAVWRLTPEGHHLVRWGVGKSPEGRSKAYEEYFDKQ